MNTNEGGGIVTSDGRGNGGMPVPPYSGKWRLLSRNRISAGLLDDVMRFTCVRGTFDDQSKAAVEYANSRLTLFDNKSTSNVTTVTVVVGGVAALLKYAGSDKFSAPHGLLPLLLFGLEVMMFGLAAAVVYISFQINNVVLYVPSETGQSGSPPDASGRQVLTLQDSAVQDYVRFLSYWVVRRDLYRFWQRRATTLALACGLSIIALTLLLQPHWIAEGVLVPAKP